ncbi:MAG: metallophosphoesterase [Kiritimatiellae bacterium]|nr:metallophosphoesterase [Kiritimatiellia bacterium]
MAIDDAMIDRRSFLSRLGMGVLAAAFGGAAGFPKRANAESPGTASPGRLLASAPVLQNAAETSIGVSFAVNALASGWVEISKSPDMSGAKRVYSGTGGLMDVNDRFALVRIRGLRPATRYWYRIGADRMEFKRYRPFNLASEADGKIHSFTTLGPGAGGSFCVIADTHQREPALGMTLAKLQELKPSVVIWNGDATGNFNTTLDDAMKTFIHVHPDYPEYAADTPWMFVNGNHDFRGLFNRHLQDLMMFRELDERAGRYASLGRNFVQRLGDIALIGLDTGEDKPDAHPYFGGVVKFEPYRRLQTRWLADMIETPAVKTAKFKVAFCHIPLYAANPAHNAGDAIDEGKAAEWHRPCAQMWGPLFEKAGVNLVITGHTHRFRHDPPGDGRTWDHIVCGGCDIWGRGANRKFPTVIEGRVDGGRLVVRVYDLVAKKIALEKTFG